MYSRYWTLSYTDSGPPIYNYYDKYIKPKLEARALATKKRPPLAWDSRQDKPLPYTWGLYFKGKRYDNIVAYDIENNKFWYKLIGKEISLTRHIVGSFCVKRLG